MIRPGLKAQLAAAHINARTLRQSYSSITSAMAQTQPAKLHGRAFYESLGSPKMILAPMVDRSEFVCAYTVAGKFHILTVLGLAHAQPFVPAQRVLEKPARL